MYGLNELLDSILRQVTFDLPSGETITGGKLREFLTRVGWPTDEVLQAREAEPVVPEELLSQLCRNLQDLLEDYIDSNTGYIGHAFPIDNRSRHDISGGRLVRRRLTQQANGLLSIVHISKVEVFAKGLIKGAAVVGVGTVEDLLLSWVQGQPIRYRTSAIVKNVTVDEPFVLAQGVLIEPLPLSSDKLPAYLPMGRSISPQDYLDLTVLSIDSILTPALFNPRTDEGNHLPYAKTEGNLDFATVCQALSLVADKHVDSGFCWNDYKALFSFALSGDSPNRSFGESRVSGREFMASAVTFLPSKSVTLTPSEARKPQRLEDSEIISVLSALEKLGSEKSRIAVSRWIKSKQNARNFVDSFIELRIALECLYLQNIGNEENRGEMGIRLSLCGAWHLGTDFRERKEFQKKLKKAYDRASRAVHGGRFDVDLPEIQELLTDAQDLCRRGILKMLKEGPPSDWSDLILGVECEDRSN